jgi:hypothetical protein
MKETELLKILEDLAFEKLSNEGRYGITAEDNDYEIRKALRKLFEEKKS